MHSDDADYDLDEDLAEQSDGDEHEGRSDS